MDRDTKSFVWLSVILLALLFIILISFGYIYSHSTLDTYNYILFCLIILTLTSLVIFFAAVIAVLYAYRQKKVNGSFLWLVRLALKILLPVITSISGLIRLDRDSIRSIHITVNNIIVRSGFKKYDPDKVLLLLPHCLQDSNCKYKVTNDIENCRRCGKCCIGGIVRVAAETGVRAAVVTGGTAARNIVGKTRPGIIFSVACERDLSSGITDVRAIPVIGMVNDRPNGPCNNTTVDVDVLRRELGNILKKET